MNVSELFIRRPVMTSLVMLAIMIFGVFAYRLLPVNDLPSIDFPTIQVRASLPGASPETMASAVATPLERQLSTIAGIEAMSSTNGQGSSIITLQFALDRDIDAAAQDVQSAISQGGAPAAAGHAEPAVDAQGQPGRLAGALPRPEFGDAAPGRNQRVRRYRHRPAHLDDQRRRPGHGLRLAEVRGARAARPAGAGQPADRPRRGVQGAGERERQPADRGTAGGKPGLHHPGERAAL